MPLIQTQVRPCDGRDSELGTARNTARDSARLDTHSSFVVSERSHGRKAIRVPLKLVIVVSMCIFTVGPAIALWMVSWQTGNNGINSINNLGQNSVQVSLFFFGALVRRVVFVAARCPATPRRLWRDPLRWALSSNACRQGRRC